MWLNQAKKIKLGKSAKAAETKVVVTEKEVREEIDLIVTIEKTKDKTELKLKLKLENQEIKSKVDILN